MTKSFLKISLMTLVVLIAGFSCSPEKVVDKKQLEGYWVLQNFEGKPVVESFKGNIPTLEFDLETDLISGSAGCNRYFGGFSLEKNNFKAEKLGCTMMMCLEENAEKEFLDILSTDRGLTISIEEDKTLTMKDGDEVKLQFVKGSKDAE